MEKGKHKRNTECINNLKNNKNSKKPPTDDNTTWVGVLNSRNTKQENFKPWWFIFKCLKTEIWITESLKMFQISNKIQNSTRQTMDGIDSMSSTPVQYKNPKNHLLWRLTLTIAVYYSNDAIYLNTFEINGGLQIKQMA